MSSNQAGKGDKPRPVNKKIFDQNYDSIFNKKTKTTSSDKIRTAVIKGSKTIYKY